MLPIVPGYLTVITGLDITSEARQGQSLRIARDTGLFILGFSVVFVLLGIGATSIGSVIVDNQGLLVRISGLMVLGMALYLLGSLWANAPWLYQEKRFHPKLDRFGPFASPVAGVAFGLGWTTDRVALDAFRGKPTVVNFFASWCIECDNELPHFATISEELRGEVNFVGIASSESGNPLYMPERHGVEWWPLARDIGSSFNGNDLAVALGMRPGSMPLTAFYDADGNLLTTNPGASSEGALRANLNQLYGIDS